MPDWVAVVVAVGAFLLSSIAFLHSHVAARAQTFLEFRKRFIEIKSELPDWFTEQDMAKWPKYDLASDDWRPIERYWQNAFDEWLVTTKLDRWVLGRLWRLFYRDAIGSALTHKPLRFAVSRLTHENTEFGQYRDEFRGVLDHLWNRTGGRDNRTICDDFACTDCTDQDSQER